MRIIFLLFLISCGSSNNAPASQFEKQYSSFGQSKNVAILIHGIWSDKTLWDYGLGLDIKNSFIENNYKVVTFTFPNTTDETFLDAGLIYRLHYISFLNWLISDLKKNSVVEKIIIGGFSFGGLHAMVAASDIKEIKEYFAIMPSMDLSKIIKGISNSNFYPSNNNMVNKKGFVISGSKDDLVDYKLGQQWALSMGQSVDHMLINLDHRLSPDIVNILKMKYKKGKNL